MYHRPFSERASPLRTLNFVPWSMDHKHLVELMRETDIIGWLHDLRRALNKELCICLPSSRSIGVAPLG